MYQRLTLNALHICYLKRQLSLLLLFVYANSFDQLAAWYTDGGYRVSPWLELLDLKKWRRTSASTASTTTTAAAPATTGTSTRSPAKASPNEGSQLFVVIVHSMLLLSC
jgi:hypothetical protein